MTGPRGDDDKAGAARAATLSTDFTRLVGVEYPVVQTGMGWVSGPELTAATANAGGLGIIASATMTYSELEAAIIRTKELTSKPFGVKVASWGADAVIVQGGEGGGHTGPVATTLLLPSVVDALGGAGNTSIPVVAGGGFFDGRGLVAALSYGAAGVAMGTRFLLTSDSQVPDAVKQQYLEKSLQDTVVSTRVDGMPHRVLRTGLVNALESGSPVKGMVAAVQNANKFKAMTGMKWQQLAKDGLNMKRSSERTWQQIVMAANTPMLLKAGLVEGNTEAGVLASGQVVGMIDDLPSCDELIQRVMTQAHERLGALRDLG